MSTPPCRSLAMLLAIFRVVIHHIDFSESILITTKKSYLSSKIANALLASSHLGLLG